jgi:exopolysaccharide biosynthesis polyprenyl glycosylphosphotransferase
MAEAHVSAEVGNLGDSIGWPKRAPHRDLTFGFIFQLGDFIAILAIPLTGSLFKQSTENLTRNLCFWPLLSVLTIILIASHGGYRISHNKGVQPPIVLAISCFLSTSAAMLLVAVLLGHPHILARPWTAADLILTPALLAIFKTAIGLRLAAYEQTIRPKGPCVICFDRLPAALPKALADQDLPQHISGVFYLSKRDNLGHTAEWPELPDLPTLINLIKKEDIPDIIFVNHPELDTFAPMAREELLAELLTYPSRLWLAFDVASNLPEMLKRHSGSYKLVPLITDNLLSSQNVTKRLFDLLVSSLLLMIALPLIVVMAGLVKTSSPGPVIFRQKRTGAHGQEFTVYKFRTMAFATKERFEQAKQGDHRITDIGRFLRKNSLDEILQLINVVRGEMSLVGPRPHAPETEVEGVNFEQAVRLYRIRHRVKPGMTGLAQIRGQRGETRAISTLEQRLSSDLEYIQTWSLWLDIVILIRTIPVVLRQTNAW